MYQLLDLPSIKGTFEIDPKNSWLLAAKQKGLPIINSWMGRFHSRKYLCVSRYSNDLTAIALLSRPRADGFFCRLVQKRESKSHPIGFFQIGGGIAGDFPICAVPLLRQDLQEDVPYWSYFCQISDRVTSFGSYSGAVPNEKITWGKLDINTPALSSKAMRLLLHLLCFSTC